VIEMKREKNEILDTQCNWIYKANDLIQKSRYSLSVQQQKIILFLISKINPYATEFKNITFSIKEFCKVCGIDYKIGQYYVLVKENIKQIADKSCWIKTESGKETLLRWIEKPYIDENSGIIEIKIDNDMKPFLLQLKENYTRYNLEDTLLFKSKYSIRLYELIESFRYHKLEEFEKVFELEELKTILDCKNYKAFKDFNTRALKPAIEEINRFTYLNVECEFIKEVRKIVAVKLITRAKDYEERFEVMQLRADLLD
jgi:plasmid replication initiation protein